MNSKIINKYLIITFFYVSSLVANSISVLAFKNNTSSSTNLWIGEMISDNLTSDLSKLNQVDVINRSYLKEILKEQKLQYSGNIKEQDQVELGKLVGARKILKGDYTILNKILIINIILVDVESGKIENSTKVEGPRKDMYVLVKQLTMKVLVDLLDIKLEEIEKLKISKYDTDKVNAIEKNYLGIYQ